MHQQAIHVYDDIPPEDLAMLQALYSRSPASVTDHLEKVQAKGSGNFMDKFYVGYGHASIGDCGVTTVFIENYSMLAAKAIQDNPLYSGQEASTRYLDFSTLPLVEPYNHPAAAAIQQGWMNMYNKYLPEVIAALQERYPFIQTGYKSEKIWQNAVNARAFDIMRGFLPVGTTTYLSWTTNLRQARQKLMKLKAHPLPEVQDMAHNIFQQLYDKYPHSFTGQEMETDNPRYTARDAYNQRLAARENILTPQALLQRSELSAEELQHVQQGDFIARTHKLDRAGLNTHAQEALTTRPDGAELPRYLEKYGTYDFYFVLDFGSYRDLQRHRNGICQVPLIDNTSGFYPWYLEEIRSLLPQSAPQIEAEIHRLLIAVEDLPQQGVTTTPEQNQYLYPMGMGLVCHLTYSVPQATYVAELRSQKTVHASLRPIAQHMARQLLTDFPTMTLFADFDADSWSPKRGEQTIELKAG